MAITGGMAESGVVHHVGVPTHQLSEGRLVVVKRVASEEFDVRHGQLPQYRRQNLESADILHILLHFTRKRLAKETFSRVHFRRLAAFPVPSTRFDLTALAKHRADESCCRDAGSAVGVG